MGFLAMTTAPNAKCQRVLVYSLYAWFEYVMLFTVLRISAKCLNRKVNDAGAAADGCG